MQGVDLAWLALSEFKASKAEFADCLIGRKNVRLGCDATMTFDGRLKDLAGFLALPALRS